MAREPLTLHELILLIEELRAAIRAGVPLELGLLAGESRLPKRLADLSTELSQQLQAGVGLEDALKLVDFQVPGLLSAAVAAGLRSGRLDQALEAVATFAATSRDLNDSLKQAMIYPSIVLIAGYVTFWWLVVVLTPPLSMMYADQRLAPPFVLGVFQVCYETSMIWGPAIPLGLLAIWLLRAAFPQWSMGGDASQLGRWRWVPGIGKLLRDADYSRFAHVLGMLVESEVPLPEALRISGSVVRSTRLKSSCDSAANLLENGQPALAALSQANAPPMLRWMMSLGLEEGRLGQMLKQTGEMYRENAWNRAETIARLTPTALIVIVGSILGLGCGLLLFQQLAAFWEMLAIN